MADYQPFASTDEAAQDTEREEVTVRSVTEMTIPYRFPTPAARARTGRAAAALGVRRACARGRGAGGRRACGPGAAVALVQPGADAGLPLLAQLVGREWTLAGKPGCGDPLSRSARKPLCVRALATQR
jgi:hypothetical protein